MFNNYLSGIEGVAIYPVFSLLVFFIFFVVLAIRVIKADKGYLKKMENLPLENETIDSIKDFENHSKV